MKAIDAMRKSNTSALEKAKEEINKACKRGNKHTCFYISVDSMDFVTTNLREYGFTIEKLKDYENFFYVSWHSPTTS